MSRINCVVLAASLSLLPAALGAQRCMGSTSFADRRAQVGADMSFSTGARSVSAGVSVGSPAGPFASVGYGRAHDTDLDDASSLISAMGGVGLWSRKMAQLCPFVFGELLDGIDLRDGSSLSAKVFGLGASLGMALSVTRAVEIVPFASAALVTQVNRMELPEGLVAGWSDRHRDVSVGAGFVFGQAITIRPSVMFTAYLDQTTTVYWLRFSSSFGRVPRRTPLGPDEGSLATVWMDAREGMYYCRASKRFGATPYGSFMTERQALAAGATPEYGRRC